MKRKKRSQQTLSGSVIMTAQELAKDRGLDPNILEREAVEYGFGVIVSGQCNVDVVRYDEWVTEQIRAGGVDIEKSVTRKSLTEVLNPGILNANITRLTDQLKKNKATLGWNEKQIDEAVDEVKKKQLQVGYKRLQEKITKKEYLIRTARERLIHLLDVELGENDQKE